MGLIRVDYARIKVSASAPMFEFHNFLNFVLQGAIWTIVDCWRRNAPERNHEVTPTACSRPVSDTHSSAKPDRLKNSHSTSKSLHQK